MSFFTYPLECILSEHCTKPNKNICINNVCECNYGYIPKDDDCIPCQQNQIVKKDVCGNDFCTDCPKNMLPTIDRRECVYCEDNKISQNGNICIMCTIDGYVVNTEQNDCKKCKYFLTYYKCAIINHGC